MSNRDGGSRLQDSAIVVSELDGDWWRNPPAVELVSNEIHVWQFPLNVPESTLDRYTELLSADEKQKAGRFHFQRDTRRFAVTRATTRSILGSYLQSGPSELHFLYSEHGKPRIKNPGWDIRFNVSHSGEQAVVAVTSGRETGVDVEQIRDNVEIDSLAERFFSTTEKDFLRGLPHEKKLSTFFRFWTCKEAFLKAQAVGLTRSLASFTVDLTAIRPSLLAAAETRGEESQWSLVELGCQTGYASALAVEGSIGTVQIFRTKKMTRTSINS
jgi:4'-phosphopantetheinyl transferase